LGGHISGRAGRAGQSGGSALPTWAIFLDRQAAAVAAVSATLVAGVGVDRMATAASHRVRTLVTIELVLLL
jgi:hypothetical protein